MKKRKVIKNVPTHLPFTNSLLLSFLLYYFKAPGFIWGVFITIYAIVWIFAIALMITQDHVDLFEDQKDKKSNLVESIGKTLSDRIENRKHTNSNNHA